MADWRDELERWLGPFVERLGHKARRRMCPLYVAGLIGPGDRKSVGPMAERVAPGDYDRLHHFVSDGSGTRLRCSVRLRSRRTSWSAARTPSSSSTTRRCRRRWTHSVAVAPQYASALGKTANCQTFAR